MNKMNIFKQNNRHSIKQIFLRLKGNLFLSGHNYPFLFFLFLLILSDLIPELSQIKKDPFYFFIFYKTILLLTLLIYKDLVVIT